MIEASGFPAEAVRRRARLGRAAAFPPEASYGHDVFGAQPVTCHGDPLDRIRLVPPIFTPARLAMLVELGREPTYRDVRLDTVIGGFSAPLPLFLSAFGSTRLADAGMTLVDPDEARQLADRYTLERMGPDETGRVLRSGTPPPSPRRSSGSRSI